MFAIVCKTIKRKLHLCQRGVVGRIENMHTWVRILRCIPGEHRDEMRRHKVLHLFKQDLDCDNAILKLKKKTTLDLYLFTSYT